MTLSEAISQRRSIRKYIPNAEISDEHIKEILTAAMLAPSACNSRPWNFIVIKSNEAKQKALSIHNYARHLKDASIGIIVCASPSIQEGKICEGFFPQDCGAAIENMLLKCVELGYGACWCGIYPRNEKVEAFTNAFNIKDLPIALVVIGKADEEPEAKGFYEEEKVRII